jgi:PhzF family phenazine biosynthesis protein
MDRTAGMTIPFYQIDAFTSRLFGGNPAGVCPLESWLEPALMQSIAAENNLAETAFFVRTGQDYGIRWFTPAQEVDLCGHATLASAWAIFRFLDRDAAAVRFESKSGPLIVERNGDLLSMRFPRREPAPCETPRDLLEGLGATPREVLRSRDYFAVFGTEAEVRALAPRMDALARLDCLGIIVTAPGERVDFVSRFFAPRAGVPEDPATGSSHCTLTPYWSRRLGRKRLEARQLSPRTGEMVCVDEGDAVTIEGSAVLYLQGTISL